MSMVPNKYHHATATSAIRSNPIPTIVSCCRVSYGRRCHPKNSLLGYCVTLGCPRCLNLTALQVAPSHPPEWSPPSCPNKHSSSSLTSVEVPSCQIKLQQPQERHGHAERPPVREPRHQQATRAHTPWPLFNAQQASEEALGRTESHGVCN